MESYKPNKIDENKKRIKEPSFADFNEARSEQKHFPILEDIVGCVDERENALDIGGGSLREARYLAEAGFESVQVIDSGDLEEGWTKDVDMDTVQYLKKEVQEYDFFENKFDIIVSFNTMSWLTKEDMVDVIEAIKRSLKKDGIFVGTFLAHDSYLVTQGTVDGHKANGIDKYELKELFEDMDYLKIGSIDGVGESKGKKMTKRGEVKVHDFIVIVRKKS